MPNDHHSWVVVPNIFDWFYPDVHQLSPRYVFMNVVVDIFLSVQDSAEHNSFTFFGLGVGGGVD